jgi:Flp pilus assembly protein TadG
MAVPLIGLAIDGTMLYIVKCRLQGAVDGAALAGGRALSRGNDSDAQKTAAINAAATWVKLNYPTNYFFSNEVVVNIASDVTIDLSVAHQRTVTVTAHITEPVLFMRFLGFSTTAVNATATTVRKDSNIILVLDRSGSMTASGSCGPMKQAAINFVGEFAPGRDNIGIISFATSTIVQVPVTTAFTQASITTAINGISCDGSTSSAASLWTAYDQLVGLNQPAALNFIVFFTDGEPTGVAANMPIAAGSPCSEVATVVPPNAVPTGLPVGYVGKYIPGLYAVYTDGSKYIGSALPTATANADGTPNVINRDQVVALNSNNCNYASGWTNSSYPPPNWENISDFRGIPTLDMFGNSLTGYKSVTLSGGYIDITDHNNGIPAATNAADDAARRIRTGANDTVPGPNVGRSLNGIIIDSIGLGNAAVPLPADGIFLERVSNDPRSPIYNNNYAAGLFVFAAQSSDIGSAFSQIASEILRIAR